MRLIIALLCVLAVAGCRNSRTPSGSLDRKLFQWVGGTIFSSPGRIGLKEILLDTGALQGREVIVEGDVLTIGKYGTYLILSDGSGRLLVELTQIMPPLVMERGFFPKRIRALGSIERGNKGFPLLVARAINIHSRPAKK